MTAEQLMEEVGVMQAAKLLEVWPNYVRTLIFMGKLTASKRNGKWVLVRKEVVDYAIALRKFRKSQQKGEKHNATRNGK